jgi:hypothetical protein
MKVLDASPFSLESIAELHRASGFDYQWPRDFRTPLFPIKRAVVMDNHAAGSRAIAVAALKVEAEAYLWMDHSYGTPEQRLEALELLNSDLAARARVIGFDQVHCALPPEIAERFGERLEQLGWKLARPWPLYVFQLR